MVAVVEQTFFLSEIIRRKVYRHAQRIGRLQDLVIVETGKLPEVSQLLIHRPVSYTHLTLPTNREV